ncbi:MAG: hypothetical protein A3G71_06075 [Gammaproteobacteria bacterium RIFCSPLOWO2_12_FULL_38_14]|nr:MAG: hypothetical protein A3G71_06075 [Gammaproteobacteria bacterium RIFCSPLOWO2_12_FULL_38_14]
MPNALKNIKTMMSDSRTRTILIFTILLLVVGIIFGFLKLSGSSKKSGAPGGSAVGNAPNIQSIPGGFDTPESAEYARLQQQQNQMQAKEASKTGKSAIPTLISSSTLGAQGFQQANAGNTQGCVAPGTPLYSSACQVIATLGPGGVVQATNANQSAFEEGDIVYGADGKPIGRIGPNGEVLNAQGQVIGYVGADGLVRNAKGEVIGQASQIKEGDLVYGPDGKVLGRVGPNGEVLDAKGRIVGYVGADGVVKNAKGDVIGQVSQVKEGGLVYGPDGKVLGRVGPNGEVLDANGRVVGYVGPDGVVRNAKGKVIGQASQIKAGELVYGPDGKVLGRVGPNGEVLDANGRVVGYVGPDGVVRNAQGQVIGEVAGTTKKPAKLTVGTPFYNAYGAQVGVVGPNGKFIPVSNAVEHARTANQNTVATAQQRNNAGQFGALPGAPGTPNPQLQALLEKQAAQLSEAEAQQKKFQMQGSMSGQVGQLLAAWGPSSQRYEVGGQQEKETPEGGAPGVGELANRGAGGAYGIGGGNGPTIKAGSIMFAVLDNTISSDEPGPILATITNGELKGGKLIGSLTNQGQKIMITFNSLNYEKFENSVSLNAVAIDPNTARTGLSDYTNNHYLLRYGTMFAASFVQGYAQAISQSGSTIVSNGFNTQKNMPSLSPSGELAVALGNVGTQYTSVLNSFQSTPPSVYVYAGTGLGVLVLNDLKLPVVNSFGNA